jgi:hypothetical protein
MEDVQTIPPSYYETTGKLGRKIELHTLKSELIEGKLHFSWAYRYTTVWHKTLKAAKERYCLAYGVDPKRVRAIFID